MARSRQRSFGDSGCRLAAQDSRGISEALATRDSGAAGTTDGVVGATGATGSAERRRAVAARATERHRAGTARATGSAERRRGVTTGSTSAAGSDHFRAAVAGSDEVWSD